MAFSGDLNTFSLADVFQTLAQNQQTGTLRVFDEDTQKYIFFSKGAIRSVSRGKRRSIPIGELLVAKGRISEEQLAAALSKHAENEAKLGATLVEIGACEQGDIDEVFRFQMEEEIYDLFTWKNARFEFAEGTTETTILGRHQRVTEVRLNTSGLIMEAMRRIDEWNRITAVIPSVFMVLVPQGDLAAGQVPPELEGEEQRVLMQVDGLNTVDAIVRKSLLGQYVVTQCLAKFVSAGMLREAAVEELYQAGEQCVLSGDPEGAVGVYQRILEVEGESSRVRGLLAAALESTGCLDEASRSYRLLGGLRSDDGDFKGAIAAYEHAGRLSTLSAHEMDRLAELYLVVNRTKDAAAMWLTRARTLLDSRDVRGARAVCEKALEHFEDSEDLLSLMARICMEEGQNKEAVAAYEQLASLYERRGNLQGALATYRSILHLDASRVDLRDRIKRMQSRNLKARQESQYRLAVWAALAVCGLLIAVAVVMEVTARRRLSAALDRSSELRASAGSVEDLQERVRLLEEVEALWDGYEPGFSISNLLGTIRAEQRAVDALLEAARDELRQATAAHARRDQTQLETALSGLKSGRQEERAAALAALRALSKKQPPNAWTAKAAEILARESKGEDEAEVLAEQIRALPLDSEERFSRVHKLLTQYPHSKPAQATRVPVRVSTAPVLPVRLAFGEKVVDLGPQQPEVLLELPAFRPFVVTVTRPGFGTAGVVEWRAKAFREPQHTIRLVREILWSDRRALSGEVQAAPLVGPELRQGGGPVLYVATTRGDVAAFELVAQRRRWQISGDGGELDFRSQGHLQGTRLYLLDYGGQLACIDTEQGKLLWPQPGTRNGYDGTLSGAGLFTKLEFYEDRLFCVAGTSDGRVVCLGTEAGRERWSPPYDTGERVAIVASGVSHGDFLYMPGGDGHIHVLRGDGKRVERLPVGRSLRAPLLRFEDRLVAVTEEGRVSAWTLTAKPQQLWETEKAYGATRAPLTRYGDQLLLATENGRVVALDLEKGSVLWERATLPGGVIGPAALDEHRLLVPAGPVLCALDLRKAGALLWQVKPGERRLVAVAVAGERIATVDEGGGLHVLPVDRDPQ